MRGWTAQLERASRLVLPEERLVEAVVAARCDVVLGGLDDPQEDPIGFLLGAHELARLGAPVGEWVAEIAAAAEQVARDARRSGLGWDGELALAAAGGLFALEGDRRAIGDVATLRRALGPRRSTSPELPSGVRAVSWVEDRLVRVVDADECVLLPDGIPSAWLGGGLECYRVPAGPGRHLSYAVRWHGKHPAVLWEVSGPPGLQLRAGAGDGRWHSTAASGETLLTLP